MPDEEQHEEGLVAKDIEIHFGGGGESIPPSDPKAQRLKSWANIIATTAALVTAVVAAVRPQDQTVSRNTYEQLKTSIEETNAAVKQNHDDMVALHNYLQGYFAGNNTLVLPPLTPTVTPPPPPPPATAQTNRKPPNAAPTTTLTFTFPSSSSSLAYAPAAPAPAPAFPLPPINSAAPPAPIPAFDSVAAKK